MPCGIGSICLFKKFIAYGAINFSFYDRNILLNLQVFIEYIQKTQMNSEECADVLKLYYQLTQCQDNIKCQQKYIKQLAIALRQCQK